MNTRDTMSPNELAFIGLANEYCQAVANAREALPRDFVDSMLRLLPRLYITATDLAGTMDEPVDEAYMENALDEDYYEAVRRGVETLLGPDDSYLEVFEQDMKYSDTPIGASVAEGLADLFQVMFNFLSAVREATAEHARLAFWNVRDDFETYWSQKLCNVLRALNHLRYNGDLAADFD